MEKVIRSLLEKIENDHEVQVIFACESGSRGWGFHSPDSDFDVRFIYVHPKDWYLSIRNDKDFIELPKDPVLDITGFELRKMLRLFRGSNAKIYEWLQSPIFYRRDELFITQIKDLIPDHYSPKAGLHHYLGLTKNTLKNHLNTEQVSLKKYFYALRPVLAALWIAKFNSCPPMEFEKLRALIRQTPIDNEIDLLISKKVTVGESYMISPIPALHDFISQTVATCEEHARSAAEANGAIEKLDQLFQSTVQRYDHPTA